MITLAIGVVGVVGAITISLLVVGGIVTVTAVNEFYNGS